MCLLPITRIVNAFGRVPSGSFFSVKIHNVKSACSLTESKHEKREKIIITIAFIHLNAFGNGNTNREGINCRYEKSKIVPHSVEYRACSASLDFSGFKRSQESRF